MKGTQRAAEKIIAEAMRNIRDPTLRAAAKKSLTRFFKAQNRELTKRIGADVLQTFSLLMLLNGRSPIGEQISVTKGQRDRAMQTFDRLKDAEPRLMGVPLQRYTVEYTQKHLRPALDALAEMYAKDPDDPEERNSLRGRAEAEARAAENEEQLSSLKQSGVKLVVVSAHADCSDRCKPFQGRVYSLDGTSGVTDDGRKFEPIERATDVYVTSKRSGKTWKNGLLGFNCRHRLLPYKSGLEIPPPSEEKRKRECAITERQREIERNVRRWRIRAETQRGVNDTGAKAANMAARAWRNRYYAFCKEHGRAVDPERLKIL